MLTRARGTSNYRMRPKSPHGSWLQPNRTHSNSFTATTSNRTSTEELPWHLVKPNRAHSIPFMATTSHRLKSSHGTWLQPNLVHSNSFMATTSNSASTKELPWHLGTTKPCSRQLLHGNYQ